MRFELLVALRFLREGRGQTIFILLGISIGVAVQVFLGTLIAALQEDLINATVGRSAHLVLKAKTSEPLPISKRAHTSSIRTAYLEGTFERRDEPLSAWLQLVTMLDAEASLTAVSPVAEGNGFLQRGGERWPVVIRGVQLERATGIYDFEEALVSGDFEIGGNRVLMGRDLADEARLIPGDNFTVEIPGAGNQIFSVAGVFDLGVQSLNETWLFFDQRRAQRLLGLGDDVTRIEMQVANVFAADNLGSNLERRLADVTIENWKEQNRELLSGLQAQSSSSVTIQVFVLLAVTLGIASVLAVSVVQKSRQIGILKAMGTRSTSASRIFLFQGGLLGLAGSILGSGFGLAMTYLFLWGTTIATGQPLFSLDFDPSYAAVVVIIATLASLLSATFPARKSARLDPIDVIRG